MLVPEADTLPEALRAAGWRTAVFSDNPFISPEFGFDQGIDDFDHLRPSVVANGTLLGKVLFMLRLMSLLGEPFGVGKDVHRGAEEVVGGRFTKWLDTVGDDPWYAHVHIMEPHLPYAPPRADAEAFGLPNGTPYRAPPPYNGVLPFSVAPEPPEELRSALRAQYDGEVRDASRWFGHALDELRRRGMLENTIVLFVADHGEELRGRGGWTHGHSLHRELVHVPLVVRVPESVAAARPRGGGASAASRACSTSRRRSLSWPACGGSGATVTAPGARSCRASCRRRTAATR